MSTILIVEDDAGLTILEIVPFAPPVGVTLSESHNATNEVTEFPVEEGANISDHVRPGLKTVSLEVLITNTPIQVDPFQVTGGLTSNLLNLPIPFSPLSEAAPPLGTPGFVTRSLVNAIEGRTSTPVIFAYTLTFDDYEPVMNVYDTLKSIRDEGKLIRILTTFQEYKDMVLVNMGALKSAQEGSGARFTLDFKEIRTVTTETVASPEPEEPRGAK